MSRAHIPVTLRRLVRRRAEGRCEYCLLPESAAFFPHEPGGFVRLLAQLLPIRISPEVPICPSLVVDKIDRLSILSSLVIAYKAQERPSLHDLSVRVPRNRSAARAHQEVEVNTAISLQHVLDIQLRVPPTLSQRWRPPGG